MAKGKTASKLSLGERRRKAFELFAKGYTNTEVARKLHVHNDTVTGYRRLYEQRLAEEAHRNPEFLTNVLANTLRMLTELDQVRQEAWKQYQKADSIVTRRELLSIMLKAQRERAELFGVLGVKAEMLAMVNTVKIVQDRILDFLSRNLCPADRLQLERFLDTPEMRRYFGLPQLSESVIEARELEAASA